MAKPRMTDLSDLLGAKKAEPQQRVPEPAPKESKATRSKAPQPTTTKDSAARAVSTRRASVASATTSPVDVPRYLTLVRKELRITQTQADQLSSTVRALNLARRGEGERITDNTLVRVAIGLLLERVDDLHGATEAELFASLNLQPHD